MKLHIPQHFQHPTLLVSSPLRRCLQTALYAFHPEFNENLKATLEKNKEFPNGCLPRNMIQKILKKGNIKWEADPRIMECINCKGSWAHFPTPVEELPAEIQAAFTFPDDLFPQEKDAEWLERKGMYKDYTLRTLAWRRVNQFCDYLYSRPEEEIIVVAHGQLLEQFLFPFPWDQPVPNASGYSFTVTWEASTPKCQKKPKDVDLAMHMEEIKPRIQ